jgi:serine/threonine-protein kinase
LKDQKSPEKKEKSSTELNDEIPAVSLSKNNIIEKGELFVKCFPWAKIYLNNNYLETTPLSKNLELAAGSYLLTLVHPDYPKYSDSVIISKEKLSFIEVNLDTLFGFLECQVYPWGDLFINGEKKGTTPLENSIKLCEGTYKLELKNPKFSGVQLPIKISRNDTLRIRINMESGINY